VDGVKLTSIFTNEVNSVCLVKLVATIIRLWLDINPDDIEARLLVAASSTTSFAERIEYQWFIGRRLHGFLTKGSNLY
jgi:hypothetical protein